MGRVHVKCEFCLLELSGIFFSNIFYLCLIRSVDAKPSGMEDRYGGQIVVIRYLVKWPP